MSRPIVVIRPTSRGGYPRGAHVVWCHEPGCEYVYVAAVKTDAQDQARYHRDHHRKAAGS